MRLWRCPLLFTDCNHTESCEKDDNVLVFRRSSLVFVYTGPAQSEFSFGSPTITTSAADVRSFHGACTLPFALSVDGLYQTRVILGFVFNFTTLKHLQKKKCMYTYGEVIIYKVSAISHYKIS